MSSESRTSKSIKNAKVSFFYYVVFMVLGFWSRKVFFDYLGSEVVGLESTVGNLLSFLNIVESGVGMSVTYFLYKPLFNGDYTTINKIVALQGWIYRRVSGMVTLGAAVLLCFFPQIFCNIKVPLWYAYATFGVFLLNALLGYLVNFRQIVLNTDQKGYKVTRVSTGFAVLIKITQIVLLPVVPHPFLFYIGSNLVGTAFGCWWLNHIINKEYPWLKTSGFNGRKLLAEYPDILKKTKQLFIHKISTVILFNATPFIMYAFSTLTVVAYYANYLLIITKLRDVLAMVYSSMGAAIGNLIASGDKQKITRVFWELFDSRFCIAFIALSCVYFLAHPFVVLWLGEKYIISQLLLVLLVINQSIFITRLTVDHYINGYGLFGDVWAPAAEGIINIGSALLLGHFVGYEGVLLGGIISQVVIICIWKPVFLFRKGMKLPVWSYFRPVLLRYAIVAADFVGLTFLFRWLLPERMTSYLEFAGYALLTLAIVTAVIVGEFLTFSQGTRDFLVRVKGVVQHKFG